MSPTVDTQEEKTELSEETVVSVGDLKLLPGVHHVHRALGKCTYILRLRRSCTQNATAHHDGRGLFCVNSDAHITSYADDDARRFIKHADASRDNTETSDRMHEHTDIFGME